MEGTFFTFETTHHALWAEEIAKEARIPSELVPTPARVTARCNLALVTLNDEVDRLSGTLRGEGVPFEIYTQ